MTTCTCNAFVSTGANAVTVNGTTGSATLSAMYVSGGNSTYGIFSECTYEHAILGKTYAAFSSGIYGQACQSTGQYGNGVLGEDYGPTGSGTGVRGTSNLGTGVNGTGHQYGVYGSCTWQSGFGVYAYNSYTPNGVGLGAYGALKAATFAGAVDVSGYLTKSGGGFRIDHPADPENKYLNHEFVESDKAKNIYDGELTFDDSGKTTIEMPSWYTHVSSNGRLMVMPHEASSTLATKKLAEGKWEVSGGAPHGTADYFVISTRSDKWMKDNHPGVEIDKGDKKGLFINPELHGKGLEFHVMHIPNTTIEEEKK